MNLADTLHFPSSSARRVRRSEVSSSSFIRPDGLEYCLSCWKSWMGGDSDRDMGIKTMRGLVGDDLRDMDSGEAQQQADTRIATATDAMIGGLERMHVWAIHRSCSIASVWRFPNADFIIVATDAKEALTAKLKNNACTAILF